MHWNSSYWLACLTLRKGTIKLESMQLTPRRWPFSVEVMLLLFSFKALYPNHVHLTRGNHETLNMNKVYGFEGEVKAKYNLQVFQLFTEVFHCLPLAYCLGGKARAHPRGSRLQARL